MKRVFVSVVAFLLMVPTATSVQSAVVEDEQIPSALVSTVGFHGFELNEVSGLRNNVSVLVASTSTGEQLCSSATADPAAPQAHIRLRRFSDHAPARSPLIASSRCNQCRPLARIHQENSSSISQ